MFGERFRFFRSPEKATGQAAVPGEQLQQETAPRADVVNLEQRRTTILKKEARESFDKSFGDGNKESTEKLMEGMYEALDDQYEDFVKGVVLKHFKTKDSSFIAWTKDLFKSPPPEAQKIIEKLMLIKDSIILTTLRATHKLPLDYRVQGKKVLEASLSKVMIMEIEKRLPQEVIHLDSQDRSILYDHGWSDEQVEDHIERLEGKNVVSLQFPKEDVPAVTRIKRKELARGMYLNEAANDDRNIPPAA